MAVKKLKSGRWEASYRDPTGRERVKHHRTRAEADRWLTSMKSEMHRGDYVDPRLGRTLFSRWAQEWLDGSAHLKLKTRADYEALLRVHVMPTFADRAVGAITSTEVRRFIAAEIAAGNAPGTVRGARKVLRLVLGVAQSEGAIRANPCDGVKVPASPKAEMVFLTAEQVEALASSIDPQYSTMIRVAAYTGMRAGEIEALRVGRTDLDAGRLTIAESVTEVQGHGLVFGQPKTYERRSVTLPPFLVDNLAVHLTGRPKHPEAFVFTSPQGEVINHKNFYRRCFKPAVRAAELPERTRFHDLRHTCAALCIALGAHPKAIQERLGHSSITVTLDRYGHLFPKLDEALTARLDEMRRDAVTAQNVRPSSHAVPTSDDPSRRMSSQHAESRGVFAESARSGPQSDPPASP
ncbi:site-specific integrase [Iamia sp. SCSIO 61187]|uniref:site-specific integrase n=1 Tax=Iamia sp. SCSIO 61187 TaxID=2722752 RepID=UPI001C627B73|nr:site-specific integrase [Iamia sp. SCSIO 61187]QYG93558.1 site-specific integrase [Iamia sp. SCSIO 61187]